jgi:hypothetical protein
MRVTVRGWVIGRALALVMVAAALACRRGGADPAPAPMSSADSADRAVADSIARARALVRPPVTLPIGDGMVTVEARGHGRVAVLASEPQRMELEFVPASVGEFVTESSRLLARKRLRRERTNISRALIDEAGGDGGALSFSRRVREKRVIYRFFFADNVGGGFPITVNRAQANALLRAMRDAAVALTPDSTPAKRQPAARAGARSRARSGARGDTTSGARRPRTRRTAGPDTTGAATGAGAASTPPARDSGATPRATKRSGRKQARPTAPATQDTTP